MFLDEQSDLLKCLECRLVGAPPKFNMPPPPPPPAHMFLNAYDPIDSIVNELGRKQLLKRCFRLKRFLFHNSNNNLIKQQRPEADYEPAGTSANNLLAATDSFTSTQSLYIVLACFVMFLIVLSIALVFLIKLFRIKKEFSEKKNSFNTNNSMTTSSTVSSTKSSLLTAKSISSLNVAATTTTIPKELQYNQLQLNTQYLQAVPKMHNMNIDEYAEINSQNVYNQYDSNYVDPRAQLNSNSMSSIESASTAPLILHTLAQNNFNNSAAFLIANNNALLFLNQLKQQQDLLANTNPANMYYVC